MLRDESRLIACTNLNDALISCGDKRCFLVADTWLSCEESSSLSTTMEGTWAWRSGTSGTLNRPNQSIVISTLRPYTLWQPRLNIDCLYTISPLVGLSEA